MKKGKGRERNKKEARGGGIKRNVEKKEGGMGRERDGEEETEQKQSSYDISRWATEVDTIASIL